MTVQLARAPRQYAGHSDDFQHGEQNESRANADALCDHGREQRHENHHDRDAVPDEAGVVGSEMVVAGTEGGKNESGEHYDVEPALAGIGEFRLTSLVQAWLKQDDQAPHSDNRKGEI